MTKAGFIGLGIMGLPMASNLAKAGVKLMVNDINGAAVEKMKTLGAEYGTKAEIGKECKVIFTILPNGAIVNEGIFGEDGIASTITAGSIVCDMSSVTPGQSKTCYEGLKKLGVYFVDAPVSGGEPGAISGKLAIMAGGEEAAFQALIPYFNILGSSALLIGPSGSGSVTKLANQIIVNMNIAAVSEAFVLAAKAGADPLKVYEAIRSGLAGSAVMDAKVPMIVERNFKPGGKISINHKDIKNVLDTAHGIDVPLPLTSQLFEIMQALKVDGHMDEDHGGIVQYFEKLAGVEVKKREDDIETLLDREIEKSRIKFIVLDDDPTGIQTVHDISVYTDWSIDSIRKGFAEDKNLFYILTNSRAMTEKQTKELHMEIARNVYEVAEETGQKYLFISRSDSTLRGHYPLETEVLREFSETNRKIMVDGEILCFFFKEGGRLTLNNIHYVKEGGKLIPAGETEFAKDRTFGYKSSDLRKYVEEKTEGAYPAENTVSISLDSLRAHDYDGITELLMTVEKFNKVIVNAEDYCDLKIFCIALYRAMARGKNFLIRSAASLVKVIGGVKDRPLLTGKEMIGEKTEKGGIVVVGSHTKKTTLQLESLLQLPDVCGIEFDSNLVLEGAEIFEAEINRVVHMSEAVINSGKTAVCYTRRELLTRACDSKEEALMRSVLISRGVLELVGKLSVTPAFVVAKGGITSSDIGTKALAVKRANILGQIRPGIPVWQTDEDSKFPGISYVIFPGNVGETDTLKEAVSVLLEAVPD